MSELARLIMLIEAQSGGFLGGQVEKRFQKLLL